MHTLQDFRRLWALQSPPSPLSLRTPTRPRHEEEEKGLVLMRWRTGVRVAHVPISVTRKW